jgi:hypothetical protein
MQNTSAYYKPKPIDMKKIFLLLFIAVFAACSPVPDNVIHDQRTEKSGFVYDSVSKSNVQETIEYYKISPTWGQAMYYAEKRADHLVKVMAAVVFFILFIGLLVGNYSNASWMPKVFENGFLYYAILFILLAASVHFYFGDANGIKWNNDKWVKSSDYKNAIKSSGSTQPIWDSLETEHRIVDGPY